MLAGAAGVAVLVGWSPVQLDGSLLLATAASLTAALCYAIGGVYAKERFPQTPPLVTATGQQLGAVALLIGPAAVLPRHPVGTGVALAVIALALACTALGFALFYRLIGSLGPTGALTVTFLVPPFGLLLGVIFLHEPLTWSAPIGLILVLAAVAMVTDIRRPGRARDTARKAAVPARARTPPRSRADELL